MVRIGDKLGLYKALDEKGPMTSSELAKETGIAERYSREWLSHQAASGYLDYDPALGKFAMTPEQAMVSDRREVQQKTASLQVPSYQGGPP